MLRNYSLWKSIHFQNGSHLIAYHCSSTVAHLLLHLRVLSSNPIYVAERLYLECKTVCEPVTVYGQGEVKRRGRCVSNTARPLFSRKVLQPTIVDTLHYKFYIGKQQQHHQVGNHLSLDVFYFGSSILVKIL